MPFSARIGAGSCEWAAKALPFPADDPAIGGPYAAVISGGNQIKILNRFSRNEVGSVGVPEAEAVAISKGWLAYLTVKRGRYALKARRIRHPANPGKLKRIASVSSPAQIGHPSVDGGRVFYAVSKRRGSSIKRRNLRSGKRGTVVRSRTAALSNPSVLGKRLLYVRAKRARHGPAGDPGAEAPPEPDAEADRPQARSQDLLHRGQLASSGRPRSPPGAAYVTLLGGDGPKIVSVKR